MDSPHDFDAVHWDREPDRPRPRPRNQAIGSRTKGGFMESPLRLATAHWDDEPRQLHDFATCGLDSSAGCANQYP
jgi:hypothetical protein